MSITDAELSAMRDIADDWLPDTCTIQTVTTSAGVQGGVIKTWANTYTSVACRLDPVLGMGTETLQNEGVVAVGMFNLNLPYDQAISVEDRVVHQSQTYEVTAVADLTSYRTLRRAVIKRIM